MNPVQPAAAHRTEKRHSVTGAILSLIFMGLGQIYHRQFIKGLLYALVELYVLIFWSNAFGRALWGLYTLGTKEQIRNSRGRITQQGDHSIFLMIEGLIVVLLIFIFALFYIYNIRDAYKTGKQRERGKPALNFAESLKFLWDKGYAYILIAPSFLFTLFITVLPLLFGVLIAFTDYSGPNHLPPKHLVDWTGLQTFADLLSLKSWSHTFIGVFAWTVVWALLSTVTTYFAGLFYALLIGHKKVKFKRFWRTLFIIPWAMPQFVSILIFRNLFNGEFGPINNYLQALGLHPVQWLSSPNWARFTLVFINIWFGFPYWMALMSGVMTNIDKEMYEAAEVDGASPWHRFYKITLPLVLFATGPLLIMSFAGNFNNFNVIYLFTQGGPVQADYSYAGSTDILITWIYNLILNNNMFNMGAAVSIIIFVLIAGFSIWNFRRTRAFKEEDMIG